MPAQKHKQTKTLKSQFGGKHLLLAEVILKCMESLLVPGRY